MWSEACPLKEVPEKHFKNTFTRVFQGTTFKKPMVPKVRQSAPVLYIVDKNASKSPDYAHAKVYIRAYRLSNLSPLKTEV